MFEREDVEKFTRYLNKYGNNFRRIRRAKRYKKYSLKQIWLLYACTISGNQSKIREWYCNLSIYKINRIHDINTRKQKMVWSITVEENEKFVSHKRVEHRLNDCCKCRMLMMDYHYDLKRQMANSYEWFRFFKVGFGLPKKHQNKKKLTKNVGLFNGLGDFNHNVENPTNSLNLGNNQTVNNEYTLSVGCKVKKTSIKPNIIESSGVLQNSKNMNKPKLKNNDLNKDNKRLKINSYDIKPCSVKKGCSIMNENMCNQSKSDIYDVKHHIKDNQISCLDLDYQFVDSIEESSCNNDELMNDEKRIRKIFHMLRKKNKEK